MNKFKKDEEYGGIVKFEKGRQLPEGHKDMFNFCDTDTEVEVIKKIIDEYIDVTDIDKISDFNNHKIDFATVVIDSIIQILNDKLEQVQLLNDENDKSLADVSHRMIKPTLNGTTLNIDEKVKLFDLQTKLLVSRRNAKDVISALRVMIENTEKCRNFILCMNTRRYTPKAERFKDNDEYYIEPQSDGYSKQNVTGINNNVVKKCSN